MESIMKKVAICLIILHAAIANAAPEINFYCNHHDDDLRGIKVVRVIFSIKDNGNACFYFYNNKFSTAKSKSSCGNFVKVSKREGASYNYFDGFYDFSEKGGISIRRAEKRRYALLQLNSMRPKLEIWSDNRLSPSVSYDCVQN